MNAEKLTQKSAEAIRSAQEIALEYGNPQIEQVHLLWALLQDSEGLIPQLLAGMGVTVPSLQAAVKDLLARQPRVSNSGHEAGKIYISGDTEKALNRAEKVAGEMKDEYTSVEHLFLGLLDTAGRELAQLFSQYQITRERALQALSSAVTTRSATSSASSPGNPKTIPFSSGSPAWVKPPLPRAWPSGSSREMSPPP